MKIFQLVGFFFPKEIALYFYEDYWLIMKGFQIHVLVKLLIFH